MISVGKKYMENFIEPIIKMSESNIWEEARKEWTLIRIWEQEDGECLCGHYIKDHCLILNEQTGREAIVGNCCIKRFDEKLDNSNEFASIKRVKVDILKSFKPQIVNQCWYDEIISNWEYEFYMNIIRKRKLTLKQETTKKRINRKILDKIGVK